MSGLTSRVAATAVVAAVIGGALAVAAPAAGATPTSGMVTAWGSNGSGLTDVPAGAQSDVKAVAATQFTAFALKTDGSVVGWGDDNLHTENVPAAAQSGVAAIDGEDGTVMALKTDGSLVGWGTGATTPSGMPTHLTGTPTQIAALRLGGMALMSDRTIRYWGALVPPRTSTFSSLQGHAVSIASGEDFGVAVTDAGSVVAWDWDGGADPAVPDAAKSGVVKVVSTASNVAAIKSDGSVVTWGRFDLGPTPAAAMSGVVDATVGMNFAVALKSDGSLVSWGPGGLDTPVGAGYQVSGMASSWTAAMTVHQPASAPTVTATPTPAVLGQPYDYALTVGGTPAPTSVQVTAGTLPAGLSMDNTGHITGTPTRAGRTTVTVTATSAVGSTNAPVTITVQPGHSTNLQFIDPPTSVATGALESDQYVRSFAERYNQTLASPLTVGGTTIPAGTKVNVYYLHDDHVGADNVAHTLTGSESFGTKVLATATSTTDLQATTTLLGNPATAYPTGADQGLEFDDSVTKYVDQTGINYTLNSYTASDAARVITLAP
jgi:hypothetical protein